MARKIRAKLIMELREQGLSRRMIAKTRRMSMESVCEVFDIAAERNIGWGDVREMADDEVYRLFYPERHVRESAFEEPDWEYVHKEMARVGVNLRLLHDEYRERCRRTGKVAMGYTKFCGDYGGWTVANSLTKRIEHKAGQSCEVDWSGPTLGRGLVDPITGEVSKVYLFVGVLPFSQKAYFEPTPDMRERTWLRCHVHMYEFWGGVPERTVCDNLKTGVTKHPREGEIVLNDAYEALGEHYMTAIMCRLRRQGHGGRRVPEPARLQDPCARGRPLRHRVRRHGVYRARPRDGRKPRHLTRGARARPRALRRRGVHRLGRERASVRCPCRQAPPMKCPERATPLPRPPPGISPSLQVHPPWAQAARDGALVQGPRKTFR